MVKTTTGEVISLKEAMRRFKKGIKNITPEQKLKTEMNGTFITLLGFFVGFVVVLIKLNSLGAIGYALILIFLGSFITTGMRYLGLKQQYKHFEKIKENSIFKSLDMFNDDTKKI